MKTKITHLLRLFVVLPLFLGIAPTARTIEPLNRLNATDATEQLPSGLAARVPAEQWNRPLGAISVPSTYSTVQSAVGDWHIECVDCPRSFWRMSDRSLCLDSNDHPHIAYGGQRLYYAWHSGREWHYETVDNSPGGQYTSLALDALEHPHISYTNNANGDLKYARYDGTSWYLETVDSGGWVDSYTSLALDESDRPHISYINDGLKYAWYDGVTWQVETIDGEGGGGALDNNEGDTSLALDESGHPHVFYYRRAGLMHAWHDGKAWQVEMVSDACHYYVSLALDGADSPHVACVGGGVKHIWHDGTS